MSNPIVKKEEESEEEYSDSVLPVLPVKLEKFDEEIDLSPPAIEDDLFQEEIHDVKVELSERKDIISEWQERSAEIFECEKCGKPFKTARGLSSHLKLHSVSAEYGRYKCNKCDRRFKSESGLRSHSGMHGDATYDCKQCGKTYKCKSIYFDHVRNHDKFGEFVCDICRKVFKTKKNLERHVTVHSDAGLHKCKQCGKSFSQLYILRDHMSVHSVKCEKCNKRFKTVRGLLMHLEVHDEATYACKLCNKTYNCKRNFVGHMKCHDKSLEHVCNLCPKVFKSKKYLQRHVAIHETYSCEECGMSFSHRCRLRKHMTTHSATAHECDQCGRTFKRRKFFELHLNVHRVQPSVQEEEEHALPRSVQKDVQREKKLADSHKFECSLCAKTFGTKRRIIAHMVFHEK